jgi:hypothetical protein
MAERHQFLDRLSPDVCKHVRQIGGDPDFVDFLLGWYGLLRMDPLLTEVLPLTTWPYWSTSRQRQVKRELQRRHGDTWKTKWKDIQARARSYEPPKLEAGLFAIDLHRMGSFSRTAGWLSATSKIISRVLRRGRTGI